MKRIAIVAVLGVLMTSTTAEACHGRARCGGECGGGVRKVKIKFGGHGGLFHHRRSCSECGQQQCYQQPVCEQPMMAYQPPMTYQAPMVYQAAPQPMVYAAPQATQQPVMPTKTTPQAVAPPPRKSTPQR